MQNARRSRYLLSLILMTSTALMACGQGPDGDKGDDEEEEATPVPVEVAIVETGDVVAEYSGTASLEAEQEAQVVAKVGGEVIALEVEEGDPVQAGQVLARLDGDRLRLELGRAHANLRKLEQEYQRNIDLYEKGLVSSGAYEGMKYDLEALRSAYRLAQLELGYTEIRAPIEGVIAERQIKLGNTITANAPVFKITDLDPLLAYLHVPERDFQKLAAGQRARVQLDALPGDNFTATVARVSPVIDAGSGTFKVTVEVTDPTDRLKPGMFGRFNIEYDRHENTVLVPRSAMLRNDDEASVFVISDGAAERRGVQTGYSNGDRLEILSGLEAGEQIVVVGQAGLSDGNPVRVVNRPAPEPEKPEAADAKPALAADASGD